MISTKSARRRFSSQALLAAAAALSASPVLAHPGHGPAEVSPLHYLTSPYHLAALAGFGAVLCAIGFASRRPLLRRGLQWTGSGMLGLALAVHWLT